MVLEATPPSDPNHAYLKTIGEYSEQGSNLVKKMLGFGRKQEIALTALNMNHLISGLETFLKATIGNKNSLELILDPHLKDIHADEIAIEQVLLNLSLNARDAMEEGVLTIKTEIISPAGRFQKNHRFHDMGELVLLTVSDTGQGMPEEVLKQIFEPFFTTKGPQDGSGLGLATAYGLIEQHKGEIQVSSEIDVGTTFNIFFPILKTKPSTEMEPGN